MNGDERRRWQELVDRGVDPRRAAEIAAELGQPGAVPGGCLRGVVAGVALFLLIAFAAAGGLLLEWL